MATPLVIDLTDKTYGNLTVKKRIKKRGSRRWSCECSCGTTVVVLEATILSSDSLSCGCTQRIATRVLVDDPYAEFATGMIKSALEDIESFIAACNKGLLDKYMPDCRGPIKYTKVVPVLSTISWLGCPEEQSSVMTLTLEQCCDVLNLPLQTVLVNFMTALSRIPANGRDIIREEIRRGYS